MKIFRTVKDNEFMWWKVYGWLGLILGNLYIIGTFSQTSVGDMGGMPPEALFLMLFLITINIILNIMILRFNKYAFLIATILSLNPLCWIINGIYLANRWCHPKVNKGKACGKYLEKKTIENFKKSIDNEN